MTRLKCPAKAQSTLSSITNFAKETFDAGSTKEVGTSKV